ncbi:MAG: response regulator transcription factor [Anaerolineae bacterium]|jgi:two-component system KDP operon response regulator KdpE
MAVKVLIVDDEQEQTTLLARILTRDGYEAAVAHNAREGLDRAHDFGPDLILLDVVMPGMDGWEMLAHLREFSSVPVIMLTAMGGLEDRVYGLDTGADDYITKPFQTPELRARIRAVLRRVATDSDGTGSLLSLDGGRLVIDFATPQVISQNKQVDLTPIEEELLFYLAHNVGSVMSYEEILDNVWGPGYEDSLANVKVYVSRLRKKIEVEPSEPRYILTRWGVGYCLAKI